MLLCRLYPSRTGLLQGLLILDFASHWFHMKAAATIEKSHHKSVGSNKNFILRFYYGNKLFFGYCCVAAEFAYILLFVLAWEPNFSVFGWARLSSVWLYGMLPGCAFKQVVNIAQLCSACNAMAELDADEAASKDGKRRS